MDIKRIVSELMGERQRLENAIKAIESVTGHSAETGSGKNNSSAKVLSFQGGRRHLSAEARRRISEAQKRRWAKRKKAA